LTDNRLRRTRRPDERAVSTVLGAILLFGLLVVTFATLRATFVPKWENDREAEQMLVAQDELASFKSSLDRLVANQTTSSISTNLDLGAPHTTFLGTFGASGSVSFAPGAAGPNVTADLFQVLLQNGNAVSTESWTSVVNTVPITNVGAVESLRLRFTVAEDTLHKNKDSVQMQVKDAAGAVLGTFVVAINCDQDCDADDNIFVNIESDDAGGNVLYNQGYAVSSPANPKASATYWVDVLDPNYRFGQLLAGAPTPFGITLTDDGLSAQYAITYTQITPQGNVIIAGGAPQGIPLTASFLGGRLAFDSANQYYPVQNIVMEGGAIILDQPGSGQTFLTPPDFRVTPLGTTVSISMSAQALTGGQQQLGGEANVQLQAHVVSVSSFAGQAPHLAFNFTTAYPTLYRTYFEGAMKSAGLLSSGCAGTGNRPACNYATHQGTNWLQLDVYGYTNSAADDASDTPAYDVALEASSGTIAFNMLP
jgi:hypothetical protein